MEVNDFADGAFCLIIEKIQRECGAGMIELMNDL
jgi:hypothetical protein